MGKSPDLDGHGRAARQPIDVFGGRRNVLPASPATRRVRAAAESEPLAVGPVLQVVAGLAAGARDVRYLVLPVPGGLQTLHRLDVHGRRIVVGRLRPARTRHLLLERRVRIDLEQVEREVLRRKRDRVIDRRQPVLDALCGQPHHQVEADVVETSRARVRVRLARARRAVQTRQPAKLVVAERLNAKAHAIDAGGAKCGQPIGGDRLGVGLECHLAIGRDVEGVRARPGDSRDFRGLQQRRRSAAEIDGVGRSRLSRRQDFHRASCPCDLAHERVDIAGLECFIEQTAIEIAVVADGGAERDVDVETQHFYDPALPPGHFRSALPSRTDGSRSWARA